MEIFCSKCGSKTDLDMNFCNSCGNKLAVDIKQEVKDKDGLTINEGAVIDSIDYEEIAADTAISTRRKQDQIAINAHKTASKKKRYIAFAATFIGSLLIGIGLFTSQTNMMIYFMIAGVLVYAFATVMYFIARR